MSRVFTELLSPQDPIEFTSEHFTEVGYEVMLDLRVARRKALDVVVAKGLVPRGRLLRLGLNAAA